MREGYEMDLSCGIMTSRGTRVSFTRSCKIQATAFGPVIGEGNPVPFGSLDPLGSRSGVYIKYIVAGGLTGFIWIRGNPGDPLTLAAPKDAYPLKNESPASEEQRRRSRVILLPITARVPVYAQGAAGVEGACALEF